MRTSADPLAAFAPAERTPTTERLREQRVARIDAVLLQPVAAELAPAGAQHQRLDGAVRKRQAGGKEMGGAGAAETFLKKAQHPSTIVHVAETPTVRDQAFTHWHCFSNSPLSPRLASTGSDLVQLWKVTVLALSQALIRQRSTLELGQSVPAP
jgi:hypothetical protein